MKKENAMPNFPMMEKDILKYWNDNNIFNAMREKNAKTGKYYAFLDGPITANNEMKLHHVWNRSLKDIMLKYKSMQGYDSCFQNGFDAQGLWVEVNVEKELGLKDKKDIEKFGMGNFVEKCIERVDSCAGRITEQSKRLGQWMDWDNSYFTNSDTNIETIWHFLKICNERGLLTEKYRPMPWCSKCGTSLSEHELADSYTDMTHTAVFIKLPLKDTNRDILVWTTTPWTLSANVAVAVNAELEYSVCTVKSSNRKLIVGSTAIKALKGDLISVDQTILGKELENAIYETCFPMFEEQQFEHKIVLWEDVDAVEGSGAVHIAPGCGAEDFELGTRLGLKNVCPVDENGIFFDNFGFLSGKKTDAIADEVFEALKNDNKLYYTHEYTHRYPICWRCKSPLIFRLSKEWYLKADSIRQELIDAVDTVEWQPAFTKKRMLDWLTNMGDWNISRKRFYGLPLPFYKCHKCKKNVVIGSVKELEAYAVDKQKVKNLPHLHKPYIDDIEIRCPYCGEVIKRVSEVGDCWLDAGITPFSTKKYFTDKDYFDKNFPCDVVIEMKEQIRLWFYSLLFMSVVLEKKAPYKKVIGFAMLVDENGNKFSKSGPNNVSFDELADIYTSDTLRYLFAANNMQNDTRFGVSICEETRRKMLGLWNTYVFFNTYAVLDNPKLDGYVPKNLDITDKWLIDATNTFVSLSKDAYEKNEYFVVTKLFETYIDDVSNFYIRANRRRFWKSGSEEDKLNAYYSLYYAIKNTTLVLAPITPFMSEYIYQNLVREMEKDADSSVIMYGFPNNLIQIDDKDIAEKTELARHIIALGQRLRAENNLKVKQPLKKMYVNTEKSRFDLLMDYKDIILEELNIKELVFEDKAERFNDEFLTVNFSAAGRVLKGEVQNVKDMLVNSSDTDMQKYVQMYKNGSVNIAEFTNLDANLFMLSQKAKKEFVIQRENSVTVVLDITLDEELVLEGIYREIVRSIQVLRKEYDFNIEQRISLDLQSSSQTLCKAIELFKQKIMEETLVKCFGEIQNAKVQKDVQINGETLQVTLGE